MLMVRIGHIYLPVIESSSGEDSISTYHYSTIIRSQRALMETLVVLQTSYLSGCGFNALVPFVPAGIRLDKDY